MKKEARSVVENVFVRLGQPAGTVMIGAVDQSSQLIIKCYCSSSLHFVIPITTKMGINIIIYKRKILKVSLSQSTAVIRG